MFEMQVAAAQAMKESISDSGKYELVREMMFSKQRRVRVSLLPAVVYVCRSSSMHLLWSLNGRSQECTPLT